LVSAAGGAGAYTYSIDGGATYQPGKTFTVPGGMYSITVKDGNGCAAVTNNLLISRPKLS